MNQPHDLNKTVDVSSVPADSLDAGLVAGFGRAEAPRSGLDASQCPVLLREAEGESDLRRCPIGMASFRRGL